MYCLAKSVLATILKVSVVILLFIIACQDLDPLQCENYREFCDSYGHIAKTCPRTCNLCHG